MIKQSLKKAYRHYLYPLLKKVERGSRIFIFSHLKFIFPHFNSFRIFGIPNSIRSIPSEQLFAPKEVLRSSPKLFDLDQLLHFSPPQIETSGGELALIKNGFATATAAALTEQGELIPEFTEQFTLSDISKHKLFSFRLKRCFQPISHFEQTVASLTVDGQWNYYHWLFDALPKIHLIQMKGISPSLYYTDTSKHFQKESLRLLGISEEKIISPQKHPTISASSLVLTTFPCKQGVPLWVCQFLRETFLSRTKKSNPQKYSRLFISRNDASYRRILNEEGLYPLLKKEGFTIIEPGTFSFEEQIAFFQSADVIVAPHGAALANLVFCKPKTKVIEILPPRFPCNCFWALSNLLDIDYFSFQGVDDKQTYSDECPGYDHMVVDPEKTKKVLEWAL